MCVNHVALNVLSTACFRTATCIPVLIFMKKRINTFLLTLIIQCIQMVRCLTSKLIIFHTFLSLFMKNLVLHKCVQENTTTAIFPLTSVSKNTWTPTEKAKTLRSPDLHINYLSGNIPLTSNIQISIMLYLQEVFVQHPTLNSIRWDQCHW